MLIDTNTNRRVMGKGGHLDFESVVLWCRQNDGRLASSDRLLPVSRLTDRKPHLVHSLPSFLSWSCGGSPGSGDFNTRPKPVQHVGKESDSKEEMFVLIDMTFVS